MPCVAASRSAFRTPRRRSRVTAPSGNPVGDESGADRNEPSDDRRSEDPVEEQLPAVIQRRLQCQRDPAPRPQPVRRLDLAIRRDGEHGGRGEPGRDERPQSVESQKRRQAESQPNVKPEKWGARHEGPDSDGQAELARARALALGSLPERQDRLVKSDEWIRHAARRSVAS